MDMPVSDEFKNAFLLSWPSLTIENLEDANLVFDHYVDLDSLDELLVELEETLSLKFQIDLAEFFPGWFSIFFHLDGAIFEDYLRPLAKRRYSPLTISKIWQSAIIA